MTGEYAPDCCPNYLTPEGFARLKGGLADRVRVNTGSVQQFLEGFQGRISRFVLLDHMDWLSTHRIDMLASEWQAIVDRAAPGARAIWRSGGLVVDYVDPLKVRVHGKERRVGDLLEYDRETAARLHQRDRVHTYGSFHIARLHTS
jgi:S-adenosylmethionine-diacylglycerol 3-amino-3-carboxypropyl transferase